LKKTNENPNILILGAGITGLSAGYKLTKGGYEVRIVEAESSIGGLATSIKYKNCIFDFGPHTFHSEISELLEFYLELMGDEVLTLKKKVKIKFNDKLIDYPLKPINMLKNLDKILIIKSAVSYLSGLVFRQDRENNKSLEDLYISLYGKKLYSIFFENYTEKVWGIHPGNLSNSFLKHRLPNKNLLQLAFQSLKEAAGLQKSKLTERNYVIYQYYPRRGSITFPEKLNREIKKNNNVVLLNSQVSDIHVKNGMVTNVTFKKNGIEETIPCDYCISTIPLTTLVNSINPEVPEAVRNSAGKLKYRAVIIICLVVDSEKVIDTDTLYFHHQLFNRMGQMNSYSKETTPEGKSALTIEITCFPDDDIWHLDESILVSKVIEGLQAEGFDLTDKVDGWKVLRNEYGYPVPVLDYETSLEKVFNYFHNVQNLYISGRQGLFTYIQMYQAMEMGFKVAEDILHGVDKPAIDIIGEYPLYV